MRLTLLMERVEMDKCTTTLTSQYVTPLYICISLWRLSFTRLFACLKIFRLISILTTACCMIHMNGTALHSAVLCCTVFMCLVFEHTTTEETWVDQKINGNISIRVRHVSLLRAVCKFIARNVGRLYHKQTENRRLRLFLRENGPTNHEPRAGL